MENSAAFWRHPRFRDMGLLKARFTRYRYKLHTHPTYVVALITDGCERLRVGRRQEVAPTNTVSWSTPRNVTTESRERRSDGLTARSIRRCN